MIEKIIIGVICFFAGTIISFFLYAIISANKNIDEYDYERVVCENNKLKLLLKQYQEDFETNTIEREDKNANVKSIKKQNSQE